MQYVGLSASVNTVQYAIPQNVSIEFPQCTSAIRVAYASAISFNVRYFSMMARITMKSTAFGLNLLLAVLFISSHVVFIPQICPHRRSSCICISLVHPT